ncbi:MAG: mechanosensitive ion channel family protein [Acidimicrobiales bacterium]|nr:mechanosensitive ion channel family protein [Acidimicrobiales bacterium]
MVPGSLALVLLQADDPGLARACGADPGLLCEWVYDATGSRGWARAVDLILGAPLHIALTVVVAVVVVRLAHRAIGRFVAGITHDPVGRASRRLRRASPPSAPGHPAAVPTRTRQRAHALGTVLRNAVTVGVWVVATLVILGELGVNAGALLAGVGIAGVALGFGAQSLVRDVIAGTFVLLEDQYGVGDVVDLGDVRGTVEAVQLRVTRLRGDDGTLWHVPNGDVRKVGNRTQGWAQVVLDVEVAATADPARAGELLLAAAGALAADTETGPDLVAPAVVSGLEAFGPESLVLRVSVRTAPGRQWAVARALRSALRVALADAGIEAWVPARPQAG